MGRYYAILDPEGYDYVKKPAFHYEIRGDQLLKKWTAGDAASGGAVPHRYYYNRKGSPWIGPTPLQFDPRWNQNPIPAGVLSDHVLTQSHFIFAPELTVSEFEPTHQVGSAGAPDNKWISLYAPAVWSSLDSHNYGAAFTAAGMTAPTGIKTVAHAVATPNGGGFNAAPYHPYLQWLSYPEPRSTLCFGFGNLLFILSGETVAFLRSPNGDRQTWELLGKFTAKAGASDFWDSLSQFPSTAFIQTLQFRPEPRSLLAMPWGWEEMLLFLNGPDAKPVARRLRTATEDERTLGHLGMWLHGSWYLAVPPAQKLQFQIQVAGYHNATIPVSISTKPLFELGSDNAPNLDPTLKLMHKLDVNAPGGWTETVDGSGYTTLESSYTNERITYALADDVGVVWESNGTNHKGYFYLLLQPGSPEGSVFPYLAPQVRGLQVRFPVELEARDATPLTLDDSEWQFINVGVSLRSPKGKRGALALKPKGLTAFEASGLGRRGNYPIHIMEEDPGDDILRARGWVRNSELKEVSVVTDTDAARIRGRGIEFEGLLDRADRPFNFLPQMVNPDDPSGHIEHRWAVGEALGMAGFDITDTDLVKIAPDPHANTQIARLPGSWVTHPGSVGVRVDSPWGPDWDETITGYVARVGKRWLGWLVYEDLTSIRYTPDLAMDLLEGYPYFISADLYRSRAEAVAGSAHPRQYFIAESEGDFEDPLCNVVRISGKGLDGRILPHYRRQDNRGISDPTYESFMGEPVQMSVVWKEAVDESAQAQLAYVTLLLNSRRRFLWKDRMPLAVWRMEPRQLLGVDRPVGPGYVLAISGRQADDYHIEHLEVSIVHSADDPDDELVYTRFGTCKLPIDATAATSSEVYPGRAFT